MILEKPAVMLVCLVIPVAWVMARRFLGKQSSRWKKGLVLGIRALLVLLLGITLSHPVIMSATDQVELFFCLDVSESIGSGSKAAANAFIDSATRGMQKDDRAGLIVFGKHPYLEKPMDKAFGPIQLQSSVNTHVTDIYSALVLAIGKFSQAGSPKIVLLSDGNENLQKAIDAAHLARSLGIQIYPVPLDSGLEGNEVALKKVEAPAAVTLQTPFEIDVILECAQSGHGQVLVFRNDRLLVDLALETESGKNRLTVSDMVSEPGLYRYKAVVNFPEDGLYQNNVGMAFTHGTRKSQILYLREDNGIRSPLARALDSQGLDLTSKSPAQGSLTMDTLIEYDAVILDNVPADQLSFQTMEALEGYVRDLGGGLIVIGGDKSFGAGQYQKTLLEKALPVAMEPPSQAQFSRLCLIFVIDKSSSMRSTYSGKTKLEMAKIAAFSSVEMLNPLDRIGMLAFDVDFQWIVPVTPAKNRREIANRLSRIEEGGGTVLYPALEEAFRALQQVKAARKHIIVLSDGETDPADFESLVASMRRAEISLSTVCIGSFANRALMQSLADWGNGRAYFTEDPVNIPKIFTGETKIVARTAIVEKRLKPEIRIGDDIMQAINDDLPTLSGQVIAYVKSGARVISETTEGPLLAVWRYGLGRSAAFMSDLSGRWGKEWVRWKHYGKFLSQLVKWGQRPEKLRNFEPRIHRQGETGILTVDALSPQNQFLNHLRLKANVKLPSEESQLLQLEQIAPGKYQTAVSMAEVGTYYFSLFQDGGGILNRPQVFGFDIPYTDEFKGAAVNYGLLDKLAAITDGRVLDLNQPSPDLFDAATQAPASKSQLWPYLCTVFLVLLLIDVAVRKLLGV